MYEVVHRGSSMDGLSILRSLVPAQAGERGSGLEWKESGEIHRSFARVASVGCGGALVVAEQRPPLHQLVRVRVDDVWVQALVTRHHSAHLVELILRRQPV